MIRSKIFSITTALFVGAMTILLLIACTQTEPTPRLHTTSPTTVPTPTQGATPTSVPTPTAVAMSSQAQPSVRKEPTPSPEPTETIAPTPNPTDTPVAESQSATDPEAFCYRTPAVQRAILATLRSTRCYGITAGELFRIEGFHSTDGSLYKPQEQFFKEGDFDGLVNLKMISIFGGYRNAPLSPGLFRDLRNAIRVELKTASEVQPGLLTGLQNVQYLELTLGDNVTPQTPIKDAAVVNQDELPTNLLCGTPRLEELRLGFAGRLSDGFFDCVPELRTIEIWNNGLYGYSIAASYSLDLSYLHKLERLTVPYITDSEFQESGEHGPRRVTLSGNSPLLLNAMTPIRDIRDDGPTFCPYYIGGSGWRMCVSVKVQP